MDVTEVTRRAIFDGFSTGRIWWNGRLTEVEFLSRLFDLEQLPSTDGRFATASSDIWQHRVRNSDGSDDWVFYDRRFNLLRGEDEVFLRFLCETLHPVVREDESEVERTRQLINGHLEKDGFELFESTRLSGRPVFAARRRSVLGPAGLGTVRATLAAVDESYVAQQITRMEAAIEHDPGLAIGTAKELLETCCKTILQERGEAVPAAADLSQLVKLTMNQLDLIPATLANPLRADETVRRLLGSLSGLTQGLAELRNRFGTGHGRPAGSEDLTPVHAKLAVGAASTLSVFLFETHRRSARI